MTDKETLITLLQKMKLKPSNCSLGDCLWDEYYVAPDKVILGKGTGYSGFHVIFNFDAEGNILNHGVYE